MVCVAGSSLPILIGKLPHACNVPDGYEVGEVFYCSCGRAWQRWM